MKRLCCLCRKKTEKWQKVNGAPAQCYDGCVSTTGVDRRTYDGKPAWLPHNGMEAWAPERMAK